MAIVVQTNVASLIAQNNLTTSTASLNQAMERMSTGYKINSAKDDAAGLYVATSLDKNIRGSEVAKQNVQMGNDMLAVAEADYVAIQDNLLRIRDLTLTAMNGVYDKSSLVAIGSEIGARIDEINRSSAVSQYNGLKLLDGTTGDITLQVGSNVDVAPAGGGDVPVNNRIIINGVFQDASAEGLGIDTQYATSEGIYKAAVEASDGPDGTAGTADDVAASAEAGLFSLTGSDLQDALTAFAEDIDEALTNVQNARTSIGAYQNRLDSTSQSLTTTIENLTSSKSTIMDADIASESSKFVSAQILQQAAGSLLVQANQAPQIALSLI